MCVCVCVCVDVCVRVCVCTQEREKRREGESDQGQFYSIRISESSVIRIKQNNHNACYLESIITDEKSEQKLHMNHSNLHQSHPGNLLALSLNNSPTGEKQRAT